MEVDLGQDAVKDQVLELLFVADVVVEGAGDDPQAGGQAAHGQGLDAVLGDDRQRLGDHRWRVSWGRRSWSSMGASNQSERDPPSVAGAPDAARCALVGRCLGPLLHAPPSFMFRS